MRFAGWSIFCASALTVLSLCAAEINAVMSLDMSALMAHPQFIKLRGELDQKAVAAGQESFTVTLEKAMMDEALLKSSRITAYLNLDSNEGIVVIDTEEGLAQQWIDFLRDADGVLNGVTDTMIGEYPALTGTTAKGERITVMRKNPSQVQIQLGETPALPLELGKINKNLLLAARSNRLFTLAVVPDRTMNGGGQQLMQQIQELQLFTLGLENTVPESTILLEGVFASGNAALQARGLVDMLLLGLMQNPSCDPRLLQGIECSVDNAKLTYTRKIDDSLIDVIKAQVQLPFPGQESSGAESGVTPNQEEGTLRIREGE